MEGAQRGILHVTVWPQIARVPTLKAKELAFVVVQAGVWKNVQVFV